nr:MAG: phosphoprotein [Jingmen bat jeilongvirus 7]
MSDFSVPDLSRSVSNALAIAGYIEENREKIISEHRKGTPSWRETISLAASFPKRASNPPGPVRRNGIKSDPHEGDPQEDGQNSDRGSRQETSPEPIPTGDLRESLHNGDHSDRDVEDPDDEGDARGGGSRNTDDSADDGGDSNSEGDKPPESSIGVRERADVDGRELDQRKHGQTSRDERRQGIGLNEDNQIEEEDFNLLIDSQDTTNTKSLTSFGFIEQISKTDTNEQPVIKKTTEENSASVNVEALSSLSHGVTQCVHQSKSPPPEKSVGVENAPNIAQPVNNDDNQQKNDHGTALERKIDSILENQTKILDKLALIGEVKEEIIGIKKSIHNLGLTVSTIESYVNSLLIVIPKSGNNSGTSGQDEASKDTKIVNPDLKMVIGRDQRRGLNDFKNKQTKLNDPRYGENMFEVIELDEAALLPSINKEENHAAKFVPSNDQISERVIEELIKRKVKDPEIRENLITLVRKNSGAVNPKVMYNEIKNMLKSM